MCMEMIIEKYKVNNIHEIWPNFGVFVHGGVSFQPYKNHLKNYWASLLFI
ncbi:GH3 family domain-containing protein [Niabella hibiscisoli]